ncbi:MAG: translation initiation factor eIF-2B [Candidatus Aenigmatarchaeota archaeon]
MSQVDETVQKIKDLEIQGAQNIAIESLKVLSGIAEEHGFGDEFEEAAEKLENARPTGVSAHNCIEFVRKRKEIEAIDAVMDYLNTAKDEAGKVAADLVESESIVLTHCHSSTVMSAFDNMNRMDKDLKVIVTETEPKLQGIKTARELVDMNIPVHYIVDAAAGLYMWAADYVLVGVDAIKPTGVLNKIGTYLIALAASEDPETEFYFVGTKDKIDYHNFSEIEERSAEEIDKHEQLEDKEVAISNPAFDLTPWPHIDGLITEDGVMKRHDIIDEFENEFTLD